MGGARILVVEDEYYIADDLRRTLTSAGVIVVGPASTVAAASKALEEAFDCAVIDLNLHGESTVPIAKRLAAEGKPFAIATGYGSGAVPAEFKQTPRIEKPFDPAALVEMVRQLVSRGAR